MCNVLLEEVGSKNIFAEERNAVSCVILNGDSLKNVIKDSDDVRAVFACNTGDVGDAVFLVGLNFAGLLIGFGEGFIGLVGRHILADYRLKSLSECLFNHVANDRVSKVKKCKYR